MDLSKLRLKPVYYSDEDNLLSDFYIPVLSESIEYKRIAGYFCSNSLVIAVKGLEKFLENGGKIKLIANVILLEEDQITIKEALSKIEISILEEIEQINDELKKDHIKLLGWLVKNKKIEIKIACVQKGIEHQKIGILEDIQGNKIAFSGSENETMHGWLYNDEQFHVFRTWIDGDLNHLNPDMERFEKLWNNEGEKVKVYPISDAFAHGLIKKAPKDNEEFQKLSHDVVEKLLEENERIYRKLKDRTKKPIFRYYQKEAIDEWIKKEYQGIFEMATGTGKTITALGCLDYLLKNKTHLVTVIVCPYNHLIKQWIKEMERFRFKSNLIIADSTNKNWKNELANYSFYINKNIKNQLIVLTTYETFSSDSFIKMISDFNKELFLIADEMHWSGAETFSDGLIEKYDYKLGLSATPKRYFDETGTSYLLSFFKEIIYSFDLKRAITEINPDTGKSYLTPYNYYPIFCELSDIEFEKYQIMTKKIVRNYYKSKIKENKDEVLNLLIFKRQKIIVNADEKLTKFEDLIIKLKNQYHILIYCNEDQISYVQNILNKYNMINHRFTGDEDTTPKKIYEGLSEREYILKKFADKTYQVIVGIKCLDEGVDIPPAQIAILLASTENPKQYIQRRGRILRRFEDKEKAFIYDLIVIPSITKSIPEDLLDLERKILEKELKRYEEFLNISDNKLEGRNIIFPIMRNYNLI